MFLHGGFCFDASDWEDAKAFRDAGFIVMLPNRRGENGQPGNFTMFYDEVEDVINAAEYLRKEAFVDEQKALCCWIEHRWDSDDACSTDLSAFSRCRIVLRFS